MVFEQSEKVLKCFRLFIQFFRTELRNEVPADIVNRYEQEYINVFKTELKSLKTEKEYLKSYIGNYIAGYYKFILDAKMVENEKITVSSLDKGITINLRKEYNLLNTPNDISISKLWVCVTHDHREYIAKILDRIYLTSHEIIASFSKSYNDVSEALKKFSMANINCTQFEDSLTAYARIAEYVIVNGVNKNPKLRNKESTKETTNKLVRIVQEKMEKAGITMDDDFNIADFFARNGTDVAGIFKEIGDDFEGIANSGEMKRDDLLNILVSSLGFVKENSDLGQTKESKVFLSTVIQVLKEKAEKDPKMKKSMGPLYDQLMEFHDPNVKIDQKVLAQIRQRMNQQERISRIRQKAGKNPVKMDEIMNAFGKGM